MGTENGSGGGTALATRAPDLAPEILFSLVTKGDVSALTPHQKVSYYEARCQLAGLAPATRPFEYLTLQGKQVLYATKSASDGLIALHGLTIEILRHAREDEQGIYLAEARVRFPSGRFVDDIGVTPIGGGARAISPADLANAMMKAITKAKRRAVLSACGLGDLIDESEVEGAQPGVPPINAPKNESGYGRGQYASPEQTESYLKSLKDWLAAQNARWLDHWTTTQGEIELEREGATHSMKEPLNIHQADGHLLKWAVQTGRLDAAIVPEEAKTRQLGRYVAIVYHRSPEDRKALGREMERYRDVQFEYQRDAIFRRFPELDPDSEAGEPSQGREPGCDDQP